MMCLIAKNKKVFTSSKLQHKLHSSSASEIDKLVFPDFIENTKETAFEQLIIKLSNKYRDKHYNNLTREELYNEKGWSDLEVLCLLKFYKNMWSIKVPNKKGYFPSFVFTYTIDTINSEINHTVNKAYQIIKPLNLETILKKRESFTALDITYLLHYFAINYTEYQQK